MRYNEEERYKKLQSRIEPTCFSKLRLSKATVSEFRTDQRRKSIECSKHSNIVQRENSKSYWK